MIRLNHNSSNPDDDIPVYEQLATRVRLAISGGRFKPGDELPSTRDLAEALGVSRGTVTRALVGQKDDEKSSLRATGWITTKRGGGAFVYNYIDDIDFKTQNEFDKALVEWLRSMIKQGYSLIDIESRLEKWIRVYRVATRMSRPDTILVVEPEKELRAILKAEIGMAIKRASIEFKIAALSLEDYVKYIEGRKQSKNHIHTITPPRLFPVALISHAKDIHDKAPKLRSYLLLHTAPEEALLGDWRPSPGEQVAIVSRSDAFIKYGREILRVCGVDPKELVVGSTWQKLRLDGSYTIFTDAVTEPDIPDGLRKKLRTVKVIADFSIKELLSHIKSFTPGPGG
jgi:DNA-binding transcriptional regulator YhcF (GntR family)